MLTATQIRKACTSFPPHAAVGTDGLCPRHLALLPDVALDLLARLYSFSETHGTPLHVGANIVFLRKPAGGERPIGILPTLYRVWGRCRRPLADQWESAHHRKYFWAAKGRSSERAVHYQGVRMEHARATGATAAGLLTDLMKACEHVDHAKLLEFAISTRFPLPILRMCLNAYASRRRLIVDGRCLFPQAASAASPL